MYLQFTQEIHCGSVVFESVLIKEKFFSSKPQYKWCRNKKMS